MWVTCTSAADAHATLVLASPGCTGAHSTARSASAIGRVRKASMARRNSANERAGWSLHASEPAPAAEQSEHMCILKGDNAERPKAFVVPGQGGAQIGWCTDRARLPKRVDCSDAEWWTDVARRSVRVSHSSPLSASATALTRRQPRSWPPAPHC